MIGYFGPITFETSDRMVRTWHRARRSRKARWAVHDVLDAVQVVQFCGYDLGEFSLSMLFSRDLTVLYGTDPAQELEQLQALLKSGQAYVLIFGSYPQGNFVVEDLNETWNRMDNRGRLTAAEVTVKLREYA